MTGSRKRPIPGIKVRAGISVLVAVCVFLLTYKGAFPTLNTYFSETVYQHKSVSTLPITIITIDEKTLNAMGQPSEWSRQVYADLLNYLNDGETRPAVISFDLLFTGHKEDLAGDIAFAEAAAEYGNVVVGINALISEQGSGSEKLDVNNLYRLDITFPYEELEAVTKLGIVNCSPDRLGYVTSAYTGMRQQDVWYDSIAVQTLRMFLDYVKAHPDYAARHPEYASYTIPDYSSRDTNHYRFSYTVPTEGYEIVSLVDVLEGKVPAKNLANNIVYVGAFASGLQDDFKTLFANSEGKSNMYGVEIHANIMEAIYNGRLQSDANLTLLSTVYALISGLLCFVMLSTSILFGILLCLGVLVLHFASSLILYRNGIYVMLLYMTLSCVLLMVGMTVYHYLSTRYEKKKISRAFRMYVAPEIVDDVAGSGTYELQLGGRHKDIAVLFVDIRGFTTMSENLAPEEVVDILNEYFGVITDAIFKNKGTLDKFIGDAAMAVFNSPFDLDDYVYRAVMTACDIAKASDALGGKLMERFGKKVSYGIGVNCGEAIIGNIGSNFRMDYTAIGDTVNTASRLESNAKAGEILISEEVKKRLEGRIETEDVGEIPLKGKQNKIFVYRVKL